MDAPHPLSVELALTDESARFKALLRRGLTESKQADHRTAVVAFTEALVLRPVHVPARLAAARSLSALQRWDEAIEQVTNAVEIQPDHAGAYLLLGELHRDRGNTDEARRAFRKAAALEPGTKIGRAAKKAIDKL